MALSIQCGIWSQRDSLAYDFCRKSHSSLLPWHSHAFRRNFWSWSPLLSSICWASIVLAHHSLVVDWLTTEILRRKLHDLTEKQDRNKKAQTNSLHLNFLTFPLSTLTATLPAHPRKCHVLTSFISYNRVNDLLPPASFKNVQSNRSQCQTSTSTDVFGSLAFHDASKQW